MKTLNYEKAQSLLKKYNLEGAVWTNQSIANDKFNAVICDYSLLPHYKVDFMVAIYNNKTDQMIERFNVKQKNKVVPKTSNQDHLNWQSVPTQPNGGPACHADDKIRWHCYECPLREAEYSICQQPGLLDTMQMCYVNGQAIFRVIP